MSAIGRHVSKLSGYAPALPTPFDAEGAVDAAAFERLCDRQVQMGATALVICGTTGEAPTLRPAEHHVLVRIAVDVVRGRVPVIAGAGCNSTAHAIELTKDAEAGGATCGNSEHYRSQGRNGRHFTARETKTSSRRRIQAACRRRHDHPGFPRARRQWLHFGDSQSRAGPLPKYVPSPQAGANCPCSATGGLAGQLTSVLFRETSPTPLKYALSLLGLMSPTVRLPLVEPGEQTRAEITAVVMKMCDAHRDDMIGNSLQPLKSTRDRVAAE